MPGGEESRAVGGGIICHPKNEYVAQPKVVFTFPLKNTLINRPLLFGGYSSIGIVLFISRVSENPGECPTDTGGVLLETHIFEKKQFVGCKNIKYFYLFIFILFFINILKK